MYSVMRVPYYYSYYVYVEEMHIMLQSPYEYLCFRCLYNMTTEAYKYSTLTPSWCFVLGCYVYAYQDVFSHDDVHFAYESTFQRGSIVNSH